MVKTKGHIHKVHQALDFLILKSSLAMMTFLATYLFLASSPIPLLRAAGNPTLGVPSYFYPGGEWAQMTSAGSKVGIAVINPDSGPGAAADANYAAAVSAARAKGIKVLGYVSTGYGAKTSVSADISTYYSRYQLDGIFLDEGPSACVDIAKYQGYVADVHARGGITVINPGQMPESCWGDVGDTLMVYENTAAGFLSSTLPAWTSKYPASKFWTVVYGADAATAVKVVDHAKTQNIGYIYVTNDVLPNPWDTLPPYWQQLVSGSSTAPADPGTPGTPGTPGNPAPVVQTTPKPADDFKCDDKHISTPGLAELLTKAGCDGKNPIFALLQAAINWLTGILGALAVLAIIVAGIQFITSQGDPNAIKQAKNRISAAVIGLVVLTLMFFILKFLGI